MSVSDNALVYTDFILVSLSLLFVFLRLYVQIFRLRIFSAADVLVVIAWLCFLCDVIVDQYMRKFGFWDPRLKYDHGGLPDYEKYMDKVSMKKGLVLEYAVQWVYFVELYAVKVAFLLLYYRWFPLSMKKLRWALHATYVFVIFGGASSILISMFWCIPIQRNWSASPKDRCVSWAALPVYLYYTFLNITTDIPVYILPFFLLPTIYRTASKLKIAGIAFVFSIGTLSIVCSVCRIILTAEQSQGLTAPIFFTLEQATALIAVCSAPLRWLWTYEYGRTRRQPSLPNYGNMKRFRYFMRSCSSKHTDAGEQVNAQERELESGELEVTAWTGSTEESRGITSHAHSTTGSVLGGVRGLTQPNYNPQQDKSSATEDNNELEKSTSGDSSAAPQALEAPRRMVTSPERRPRQWWGTRKLKKAALKRPSMTTTFGGAVPISGLTNLGSVAEEPNGRDVQFNLSRPGCQAGTTAGIHNTGGRGVMDSFTFGPRS